MAEHGCETRYPSPYPWHVRLPQAFDTCSRQLDAMRTCLARVGRALTSGCPALVLIALADLNCVWSLLDARLDLMEGLAGDAAGALRTLAEIGVVRDGVRKALAESQAFAERHHRPVAAALLRHVHQLATRLVVHEEIVRALAMRRDAGNAMADLAMASYSAPDIDDLRREIRPHRTPAQQGRLHDQA